jgi:haloalkane dehalogenase
MKVLRTPDEHFTGLPDYPFASHYIELKDVRMHYIDEGDANGKAILLLHGEPSWSYLYRFMIPILANAGFRVIAPDLIGFGKSDKPASQSDYSYKNHVSWMTEWIQQLNLHQISLFCQDWGSLIGLRVAAENKDRFSRIVLGNGGLPTGDERFPRIFKLWQMFARWSPWFPIGKIVDSGTSRKLSSQEIEAYNAPFPNKSYKKGARAFPRLVPTSPNNPASAANKAAWEVFKNWEKPFLTLFSSRDPITRGGEKIWQNKVPGAKGQAHTIIHKAGHFLQEDKGEELANLMIDFINNSA